ncbi:MAG TPA: proton-conducting transporter membrane subunit [Spirochaetota bacterium]|nr:proton-conducting transporter membrane subunit [Spirochaetota bacterium]HPF05842.1 proton-conducting transporter membrane subunit [Spirochaetota bacterium]
MNTDIYGNLLTAMAILAASAVVSPIAAGAKRKMAGWINFIMVTIAAIFLLHISYAVIFKAAPQGSTIISFGPVGIYFLVDSFSAFFIAIVSFMAVMSSFYSIEYMDHYHDYSLSGFYFNLPVFILGMIALLTVDDLTIGFTIAWQLMTIASYFLIKFEFREKNVVYGANKYLVLMELAWALIVGATFLVSGSAIGDSLHAITNNLGHTSPVMMYAVYGLILVGFGFKAGMFPFGQLWLPDAHSIAPSPISALLSGVMLKTGIYGIMRTFFWMIPHGEGVHFNGFIWGSIIATFGVVTLFVGTVQSMKQSDSKRLLAYSSIGQLGYIIFAIGAALVLFNTESQYMKLLALVVIIGALYHVINHAVFKGLLFLVSGSVLYTTGTKDLNKLGGLINFMPVTAVVAGIASLSIAGVPPFSGFASKWTIISSTVLAGSGVTFLVIFGIIALFTSAVTLSCYVKFFGMTFTSTGTEWTVEKDIKEVPFMMLAPKVVLTALCIIQGLLPFVYYNVIIEVFRNSSISTLTSAFRHAELNNHIFSSMNGITFKVPAMTSAVSSAAVPVVILIVVAIAFVIAKLFKSSGGSEEREAPTWLCGYAELNNLNRYPDRSMFASLKGFLWWTGGNVKK